jgi:phage N-6-adenine-methyltransferase
MAIDLIPATTDETTLSAADRHALEHFERIVEKGMKAFVEMGEALRAIRESRLYRASHATFEEYCKDRWGMVYRYANNLISASEVVGVIGNGSHGSQILPANERQARPLTKLPPEEQADAWNEAVEVSEGKPTARVVEEVVQRRLEPPRVPHVAHNSGNNEWYTPPEYIEAARAVMGGIDLDPASSAVANATVQATRYYTAEDDGLGQPWAGRVWMNPPYESRLIKCFAEKLRVEVTSGEVTEAIVLVNNATETSWFSSMISVASAVCFPQRRIRFIDPNGMAGDSPLQGQAIIYIGPNQARFIEEHRPMGSVMLIA